MSAFDTSAFLDQTTDEVSLKRPPLPVGDYTAVIGELGFKEGVSKSDSTKTWSAFNIPLEVDVPYEVQQSLGLTNSTLKITDLVMLDINTAGHVDYSPGKNGRLRQYREATGNNTAGQKFSPRLLTGNVILVKIGHREYPEGSGEFSEQVKGVAKK